ncbi:hypothetical protein TrCOL_g609 [Triparma columacea]|uniref:Selenoprotein O n=1 Tax=Triparma columacea TaxID=722753 RepID=A0A9W7FZD7_9STRA|nr:hypothetical protein TrCOL_g609 [Triparma columacea]
MSSPPHPTTSKLAVKSEMSVGKSPGCGMIGFNGTATPPPDLVSFRYSSLQWYDPTPVEKGDGRCHSSIRGDRGWKGLGKTPLGTGLANDDGRATFQAVCREYLLSHALSSLRVPVIPTTNLFLLPCLEDASIRDRNYEGTYYLYVGGVLERGVGRIHRLGQVLDESSFNEVCKLTHKGCDCSRRCFFNETAKKLGIMAGSWAAVGFTHGNLNSDNISVDGLTFDLNVASFLGRYDLDYVSNKVDEEGLLYSFGRQAEGVKWMLRRTAEILGGVDLVEVDLAFDDALINEFHARMELRVFFGEINDDEEEDNEEEETSVLYPRPHQLYRYIQLVEEKAGDWELEAWEMLLGNDNSIQRKELERMWWDEDEVAKLCTTFDSEVESMESKIGQLFPDLTKTAKIFEASIHDFLKESRGGGRGGRGSQGSLSPHTCSIQ